MSVFNNFHNIYTVLIHLPCLPILGKLTLLVDCLAVWKLGLFMLVGVVAAFAPALEVRTATIVVRAGC
jgi:hypothetical protein